MLKLKVVVLAFLVIGLVGVAAVAATVPARPVQVVKNTLAAWKHEDWTKMYGFLSARDKKQRSLKQFVRKRQGLAVAERLIDCQVKSTDAVGDNDVFVRIVLVMLKGPDTRVFPSTGWRPTNVTTTWDVIRKKIMTGQLLLSRIANLECDQLSGIIRPDTISDF